MAFRRIPDKEFPEFGIDPQISEAIVHGLDTIFGPNLGTSLPVFGVFIPTHATAQAKNVHGRKARTAGHDVCMASPGLDYIDWHTPCDPKCRKWTTSANRPHPPSWTARRLTKF